MTTNKSSKRAVTNGYGGVKYHWLVLAKDQGQMVIKHQPQIAGRAEGAEGRGLGLRLWIDSSDRTWQVRRGTRIIASGSLAYGLAPTVEEAIKLAAAR
jgi:hypothetical protein